ncbi:protein CHUP1, chloroplastic-like [Musa troglodytarum]|uniref:Protein CHUP1, chloroplastic-like n=1 Tax=Musa troglodytarum TaxID=320322 RepID=A0A9E7G1J2_9LILI|nr:protein CHUP1, chloroplastic-like [Musa troglodytarum]
MFAVLLPVVLVFSIYQQRVLILLSPRTFLVSVAGYGSGTGSKTAVCSTIISGRGLKDELCLLQQVENQRLKVAASQSSGTMRELRSAKLKIKHLKKRLRSCRAQAGKRMNSLQHRIAMLQNKVDQAELIDADVQIKLQRLEALEDEADDLRKATSQAEGFEEVQILREANHKLVKRAEQLQTDHHAEVEELPAEKDPIKCRRPKHDAEDRRSSTSDVILSSCKPKLFLGKLKKLVRRRGSQSSNDISESCITFETRAAASTSSGDPTPSGSTEEQSESSERLLMKGLNGCRLGFAVSVPLAGYFLANPRPAASASSAGAESRAAVGKSDVPVSSGGVRNLKDEIHIQEIEEALANILHGTSTTRTTTMAINSIQEHSASSKDSWDEDGSLLPQLKQLSPRDPEGSLMKLTHGELGVEKVDMEQEIAYLQERDRSNLINHLRELEDQLRIKMMKANGLPLQVQSLNEEYQSPRIQDSAHLGAIGELESVEMMINRLLIVLKSHWLYSRQKGLTISDDKNQKMPMEVEAERSNFSNAYSNSEQKNLMLIQRLESAENLASSCSAAAGQEVEAPETNYTIEANETARDVGQQSDDDSKEIVEALGVRLIEDCSNFEQRKPEFSSEKGEESCTSELVSAETEKKAEEIVDGHANLDNVEKNLHLEESDTQVPENRDEPMNSSSGVSSTTSSGSVGKSKHQSPHRRKLLSKLKKMLLGKHSHSKEKIYRNKTPTRESISACSSDDARSTSSHSMLSWFMEEDALADGLSKTKSSDDRWKSNSAWCQSFFRHSIGILQAKSCDLRDEDIAACCRSNQGEPLFHRRNGYGR